MASNIVKITAKQARPFIEAAGIEYSGRKFKVEFATHIHLHNLNWDGGSKNDYTALRMADVIASKVIERVPWANHAEGARVELKPGFLVIEHARYCGADLGITIYAHPSQAGLMLVGGAR